MTIHPSIKILVVLCSLCLGGFIIWQMTNDMSGPAEVQTDKKNPEEPKKTESQPMIMSSKSAGGSVRLKDIEELSQLFPDDPKANEEEKKNRPLLPGSKSFKIAPKQESFQDDE